MKTETGEAHGTKTDSQMQEEVISQLRKRNAELETQIAEGKRLLLQDMKRGNDRTELVLECREEISRLQAEIDALKPKQLAPDTEMISVQEAWEAAGGNAGMKATKAELIYNLQLLDAVCDDLDEKETEADADLPMAMRAVLRKVAVAAIDLALTDLAAKMEPILREEPTLGLAGHRRMTAHVKQLCAVRAEIYIEAAIRESIEQTAKERNGNRF